MYVNVILPIKWKGSVTYGVPEAFADGIFAGSWVSVTLRGRSLLGVVEEVFYELRDIEPQRVKDITAIKDTPMVTAGEIKFWKALADYYMCTCGEVFRCAYPHEFRKQVERSGKAGSGGRASSGMDAPDLSEAQKAAADSIRDGFGTGLPVLLKGVTGSGKTEIYMTLAREALRNGGCVLYLVPEIAVSRQLSERLAAVFGESLRVYHSKTTAVQKRKLFEDLKDRSGKPFIVLGTRSAIFLPFRKLSLIIIDEEHDPSYKQDDPAPRYNGRDAALMLARMKGSATVLGSATPSLESLYNVKIGRYRLVELKQQFHRSIAPDVEIVDERMARRLSNMRGSFTQRSVNAISKCLENHAQVMVFRSRRAYSPVVQCGSCGDVPKCPHCNVSLTYHKFSNSLSCHYCGYGRVFDNRCGVCGNASLSPRGAGTERIEEELHELFPDAVIERFDADSISSRAREEAILKAFASGKTDILVGTQMISKGFDFENLNLVVALGADSLLAHQDFRADERAVQLLKQLCGRAGRRGVQGRMLIQTMQPDHPVFEEFRAGEGRMPISDIQMDERRKYAYPPFVRMVQITVKDSYEGRLSRYCGNLARLLGRCGVMEVLGPATPAVDRINNRYISQIWVKLRRDSNLSTVKAKITEALDIAAEGFNTVPQVSVDVDPS